MYHGNNKPCRGMLLGRNGFYLLSCVDKQVIRCIQGEWTVRGSFQLIYDFFQPECDWVRALRSLLVKHKVSVVAGNAFLGAGGSGRVFRVIHVDQSLSTSSSSSSRANELALKIVIAPNISNILIEHTLMANKANVALVNPTSKIEVADDNLGSGYLMPIGKPVTCPVPRDSIPLVYASLFQLHVGGIFHGDARLPNVLYFGRDGGFKWIDLMAGRGDAAASTGSHGQRDVRAHLPAT